MKKNQNKSKVEERKSVANQCDYSRMNGKCGRAMCEHFGQLCPGRSCEDWSCNAEGGEEVKVEGEGEQRTCRNNGGNGFCSDHVSSGGEKSCIDCEKVVNRSSTAVAVAQPLNRLTAEPLNYKSRVSDQYAAIETAKENFIRECVKFGALLTEVGYYLGETQGKKGEGLQAWLEENCPEVNYSTAMGYKALAGKVVKMIGGGSQAVAVLQDKTEVIPPGEDAPIEVESKFIEKRDELFKEATSRRQLEQMYLNFAASEGKGKAGRPKGTGAGTVEYKKKSTMECAVEAVWPIVQHLLKHRGEMFTAYKILPDEKLIEMRDTLNEHVKAIASVLGSRSLG